LQAIGQRRRSGLEYRAITNCIASLPAFGTATSS
jgi:hypothetical protein